MSEFEYFSVVVSVVLGLGIADILRFFGDSLANLRQRKSFWIQIIWLTILLETHVEFWWQLWGYRERFEASPALVYLLIGPALLFIATRTLLSSIQDDRDIEMVYFERRIPFFSMLIAMNVWGIAITPEPTLTMGIGSLVGLAFFLACISVTHRWVHAGVVLIVAVVELVKYVVL